MFLQLPDYKNCIANIPNSILKYFGAETAGDTLPALDEHLDRGYKNVVLFVADGMGSSIIRDSLESGNTFRSHVVSTVDSVFLSSTVPATTSLLTGLQPCEHAWLGWDNYYKDVDKNVTVFGNVIQNTTEPAAEYNVPWKYTPYRSVIDRLKEAGVKAYASSPFAEPNPDTLDKVLDRVRSLCSEPGRKYIYAYWPSPDDVLHKYGCGSDEVCKCVRDIERKVTEFAEKMEDTLLIVTADHGHINTRISLLEDYPGITDCLERLPSLEPRVMSFHVKKGRKRDFVREFNKAYGDDFKLLTKKEVLERRLFGTGQEHPEFRDMLGDYLAIATGDLSIKYTDEEPWRSMHGGISYEEVKVPLIICKDRFFLGTDADKYVDEAVRRLQKTYPWACRDMLNKHYSYAIEDVKGRKEFVKYYTWDNSETKRYSGGWDGELFVEQIVDDHRTHIEWANDVKEVFDVRPDYGVDCHGWHLESFEFRSHMLGGYSAFVQAGDRSAGGSRTFFFSPDMMSGTFEEFLQKNGELLSGAFGLDRDYMRNFAGLKEFLGFRE